MPAITVSRLDIGVPIKILICISVISQDDNGKKGADQGLGGLYTRNLSFTVGEKVVTSRRYLQVNMPNHKAWQNRHGNH